MPYQSLEKPMFDATGNLIEAALRPLVGNARMHEAAKVMFDSSEVKIRHLVASPPPVPDEDLKPGRMADHLMVARGCSLAVWTFLGICLMWATLFRFRARRVSLLLARRINALLLPADWAWMLGAGVVLPFGLVFGVVDWKPGVVWQLWLLLPVALWIVVTSIRALLGTRARLLSRGAVALALIPVYACGMLELDGGH